MEYRKINTNTLFHGDNLEILKTSVPDASIDLVYLDPPFGSNRNYRGQTKNGENRTAVFSDTWKWNGAAASSVREIEAASPGLGRLLEAVIRSAGTAPLTAYLVMMAPRLLEIHRVLKDTGSVYLHCDPTSSHYLKIVMDAVFGLRNFRNEIVWTYKGGGRSKTAFARKHDIILFYSKSGTWTFNSRDVMVGRTNRTWFTDEEGKRYWLKYGKRYYLKHEGKVPEDWWADIGPLHGPYTERLGYPTQKPLALLERILRAGSDEGGTVLAPFCGSGTTLVAAQSLNRRWLGIDSSADAVEMSAQRLRSSFPGLSFTTVLG
jgi:site-specific DNA-methyltransferase (adenine-specific)